MNEATQRILTGITLTNGWTINEPVLRADGATGSQFSTGFIATNSDGKRAFVKVLDLAVDPNLDPDEQLKDLQTRLALFNYERDLLEKCVVKNIRRVVRIIDRGTHQVEGETNTLHFIMFELAERDLNSHASLEDTLNTTMNMHIIHQTSLALEQLHFNQISHQDLKPSNVLIFSNLTTKLCYGRCILPFNVESEAIVIRH